MRVADPKTTAARAFVRSLNILLRLARLYGYEHSRTSEQLKTAWEELRAAIPLGTQAGLLLAATGAQLLLDGVPVEGSPAEKQFAQLLSAAGLASVQFFPCVTEEELGRFARAFRTGKAKPADLAQQLKSSLSGAQGIRINEVCFVATDPRLKEASMAAQLAASTLGDDQQLRQWLNDPQKLLEMIAAAEGAKSSGGDGTSTSAGGSAAAGEPAQRSGSRVASTAADHRTPSVEHEEEEIYGVLSALTSFGKIAAGGGVGGGAAGGGVGGGAVGGGAGGNATSLLHQQVAELPGQALATLKQALAELAVRDPSAKPDKNVLVQLAEHLAIRFALESFERGEVKVNAVRQMLDRMNREIENLRKIVGAHEEKMSEAGILSESHLEILDRQFWASVPPSGKRAVLLSGDAWCVPPRNVQSFVNDLVEHGDIAEAVTILENYAACADKEEADARRKTAVGLSEMAALYAKLDPKLLGQALCHLGVRLSVEQDDELQALASAAFVRLSQEAAVQRSFPAMEQALQLVNGVEAQRPGLARSLRSKMGIEERVPDFVEEALRARQAAAGLTNVLRQMPQTAVEQLSARFNRCALREDAERVANLAGDLGEEGLHYLRSIVRGGPFSEAVEMVGLLSKLDPKAVAVFLPGRMKEFPRSSQDRVVRQIAASGAAGRCSILLELLDRVDPLVMPLVVDEIGITGNREALGRLLTILEGDLPSGAGPYLRVRAAEALGRINAPESVSALKRVVESRKLFGWAQPEELRIAALQALEKLDPLWAGEFLPKSGLEACDLILAPLDIAPNSKFVRQRRHTRVRLNKPMPAVSVNLKENFRMDIRAASLAGGIAAIDRHIAPGTPVQIRMQLGLRHLEATALMRDYRAHDMAFEFVDMSLGERGRFRRLLAASFSSGAAIAEKYILGTSATTTEPE